MYLRKDSVFVVSVGIFAARWKFLQTLFALNGLSYHSPVCTHLFVNTDCHVTSFTILFLLNGVSQLFSFAFQQFELDAICHLF